MKHHLSLYVLAIGMGCLNPLHATLVEVDNFDLVSTDTVLSAVNGWSLVNGTDDATVTNTGSEAYMMSDSQAVYLLSLSGDGIVTSADGQCRFSMSLALTDSTDAWRSYAVLIGENNNGIQRNGLAINFNGGTTNGSSDNYIRVSDGTGTSWSDTGLAVVPDSEWVLGHAYTITIDFTLLDTGVGQNVTGAFSLYDDTAGSYLIENLTIGGLGTSGGAFDTLNSVRVNWGGTSNGGWVSDDYMIGAIPEPETMGIVLGALCVEPCLTPMRAA